MNRIRATAIFLVILVAPLLADERNGIAAFKSGDFKTAWSELEPLAKKGSHTAQYYVGRMCERGQGTPRNYVKAHVWYNLAAAQGSAEARLARNAIEKLMAPEQIAEAQSLARIATTETSRASSSSPTAPEASSPIRPSRGPAASAQQHDRLTKEGLAKWLCENIGFTDIGDRLSTIPGFGDTQVEYKKKDSVSSRTGRIARTRESWEVKKGRNRVSYNLLSSASFGPGTASLSVSVYGLFDSEESKRAWLSPLGKVKNDTDGDIAVETIRDSDPGEEFSYALTISISDITDGIHVMWNTRNNQVHDAVCKLP